MYRLGPLHLRAGGVAPGRDPLGFPCADGPGAIIPIVLGDAAEVQRCSDRLFELGVLVAGFTYPVVPRGAARLRVQASAGPTDEHLTAALDAFARL